MKNMSRRCVSILLSFVTIFATNATVYASEWSAFSYVGDGVSVSFAQVQNTTWTWKFRNDGSRKITYMKFTYSYVDANTGQYTTDSDVLPGSLKPGETFGGWAAFTSNSRLSPTIRIVKIDRE